ncbi:MAG: triphosphoribosyl-dephospho-CoA synthase [Halobacteria archaeon]
MHELERMPAETAELALLLEVGSGPKPGNVDREHDHPDMDLHGFISNASELRGVFEEVEERNLGLGEAVLLASKAVSSTPETGFDPGTSENTQFGSVLLLTPLVKASRPEVRRRGDLRTALEEVLSGTTPEDTAEFYRCFRQLDVHVSDDPPAGIPDVHDPEAVECIRKTDTTLSEVMAVRDDLVAEEWRTGYRWSFETAQVLESEYRERGSSNEAVWRAYLWLLSRRKDSLVSEKHGERTAEKVRRRAKKLYRQDAGELEVRRFDAELIDDGINPGATADVLASGIYVNLWTREEKPSDETQEGTEVNRD